MIEDCFVYGWRIENDDLLVDLDFSLWPDNAFYEPPKPGEWTCYKRGTLIARKVEILEGLISLADAETSIDADGTVDYGSLDSATIKGDKIELWGPFGGVRTGLQDVSYTLD